MCGTFSCYYLGGLAGVVGGLQAGGRLGFAGLVSPICGAFAGPASTLAVRGNVQVSASVGMFTRAMSLERMSTAPHVLCMGNRLHMRGVDAITNPTQVVEFESFWDRANKQFVRESVGFDHAAVNPKLAITVGGGGRLLNPTTMRIRHDLGQKSI